jgi:outer membrane protein assembly factor BamB
VDQITGADVWRWFAPADQTLTSNVVMTNNVVFVASNDTLYGIDRRTGSLLYDESLGTNPSNSPHNLAYFDGAVFAIGSDRIQTLRAVAAVPEAGTTALLFSGAGSLFLGVLRRRKKGAAGAPA